MLDIATINTEISHHYSGILNSEFIHRILNSELYSRSIIPIQGKNSTYTYFVYLSFWVLAQIYKDPVLEMLFIIQVFVSFLEKKKIMKVQFEEEYMLILFIEQTGLSTQK